MHNNYADIRALTDQAPPWFDEHAVPRYVPFHPDHCANIYAREVVLLEIACQDCHKRYTVAMTWDSMDCAYGRARLSERVADGSLHYGDPPNACGDDCMAGASMNCIDLRVLEFWNHPTPFEWVRRPELEVALEDLPDRTPFDNENIELGLG